MLLSNSVGVVIENALFPKVGAIASKFNSGDAIIPRLIPLPQSSMAKNTLVVDLQLGNESIISKPPKSGISLISINRDKITLKILEAFNFYSKI